MSTVEGIELAWMAGFFDGEGHVGIHSVNDRRAAVGEGRGARLVPRIVIGQRHREPLEGFQARFGGGIRLRNAGTEKHAGHFAWELGNAAPVRAALVVLMPYVRLKNAECQCVLELCERMIAWRRGQRLTVEEVEARNDISRRWHEAKISPRSQYALYVPPIEQRYQLG